MKTTRKTKDFGSFLATVHLPGTHYIDWRIEPKDGPLDSSNVDDSDVIKGSAKWDGCYDFHIDGPNQFHACDITDFIEALQWVEAMRMELIENAE